MLWSEYAFSFHSTNSDNNLSAQQHINVILQPFVVPFVRQHSVVFQRDNARADVARVDIAYLFGIKIRNKTEQRCEI